MMENIIAELYKGNFSCVISNKGVTRTFTQRGIADLYDLSKDNPHFLKGAMVADKVIGKGAAAIMIQSGVQQVYAHLISEPAHTLLISAGIKVKYKEIVHHIENRDKTDWCPLEKSCKESQDVSKIITIVNNFIAKIRCKY